MQLNKAMSLEGRFKIEIINAETGEKRELDWQDNVILKKLFSLSASLRGSAYCYCLFGAGTTTPNVNDTVLASPLTSNYYIGTTNSWGSPAVEATKVGGLYTKKSTIKFVGAQGAVQGNVTELGLSLSSASSGVGLFTRALIKDTNGNPTSISLGVNDILTVYYSLTMKMDVTNKVLASKQITFNGSPVTVSLRVINYNKVQTAVVTKAWAVGTYATSTQNIGCLFPEYRTAYVVTGTPADLDDISSGQVVNTGGYFNMQSIEGGAAADGDSINPTELNRSFAAGVATGTWNMILFSASSGSLNIDYCGLALVFDPPLVKAAGDRFDINSLTLMYGGAVS